MTTRNTELVERLKETFHLSIQNRCKNHSNIWENHFDSPQCLTLCPSWDFHNDKATNRNNWSYNDMVTRVVFIDTLVARRMATEKRIASWPCHDPMWRKKSNVGKERFNHQRSLYVKINIDLSRALDTGQWVVERVAQRDRTIRFPFVFISVKRR